MFSHFPCLHFVYCGNNATGPFLHCFCQPHNKLSFSHTTSLFLFLYALPFLQFTLLFCILSSIIKTIAPYKLWPNKNLSRWDNENSHNNCYCTVNSIGPPNNCLQCHRMHSAHSRLSRFFFVSVFGCLDVVKYFIRFYGVLCALCTFVCDNKLIHSPSLLRLLACDNAINSVSDPLLSYSLACSLPFWLTRKNSPKWNMFVYWPLVKCNPKFHHSYPYSPHIILSALLLDRVFLLSLLLMEARLCFFFA